ncbi:chromodomain-helicase-DNA-binding protein 2-like [Erythrolamprus reginae]|uniref:chromodomain-helicase-DNA-binding protein 2-like n=1 Tax=Erythrolamprus reginae TaxID=121349 RepID=UPI00396C70FA
MYYLSMATSASTATIQEHTIDRKLSPKVPRKNRFPWRKRMNWTKLHSALNLWTYVSKFIEFNTQKLYKLYKKASRKRDREQEEPKKKQQKEEEEETQLHPEIPGPSKASARSLGTLHPLRPKPQPPGPPHSARMHGDAYRQYNQPPGEHFSHTGRREWHPNPQFNPSWNDYSVQGRNRHYPHERRWQEDSRNVAQREQHWSSRHAGNNQPSTGVPQKHHNEEYGRACCYQGPGEYRYHYEPKRQRLGEFRAQSYQDYRRTSNY